MKVLGITAEYNPFHKGHAYQIEEARRKSGCDLVIAAMSGDWVQRGGPAILEKKIRVQQALMNGVDCVLELPVGVSTSSAEGFAYGAVSLLSAFGCNCISYGLEEENQDEILKIAGILHQEPETYQKALKTYLAQGKSFPAARELALRHVLPGVSSSLLSGPNNILAIEYEKALLRLQEELQSSDASDPRIANAFDPRITNASDPGTANKMSGRASFLDNTTNTANRMTRDVFITTSIPIATTYPITRKDSGYSNDTFGDCPYASATAIRKDMLNGGQEWKKYVPQNCEELPYNLLTSDDFSTLLGKELLLATHEALTQYEDLNSELANRILKHRNKYAGFEDFVCLISNKTYTQSRVRRLLTRLLLNLKDTDTKQFKPVYIRMLGMKKESSPQIGELISHCNIPVITRAAQAEKILSGQLPVGLRRDMFASNLYKMVLSNKHQTKYLHEYEEFFTVM